MYEHDFGNIPSNVDWLIRQANQAMARALEPAKMQGATKPQSELMFFLSLYPDGASAEELARWSFRRMPAISHMTIRLEKLGMISRRRRNGRFQYFLTEAGKEQVKKYIYAVQPIVLGLSDILSDTEMNHLIEMLKRIRDYYLNQLGLCATIPREVRNPGESPDFQ